MAEKILMPALSPTMTEGTLAKWHVAVGDTVESGMVIAEIETDKATMEVEAVDEGTIGKILVSDGTEGVAVNTLIAVLLEDGDSDADMEALLGDAPASAPSPAPTGAPAESTPAPSAPATPTSTTTAPANTGGRILISPLAARMAAQAGLDIATIAGSGPNGRIVKSDIEKATAGGAPAPQAQTQATAPASPAPQAQATAPTAPVSTDNPFEPEFELLSLNNMRKTIARRLLESKQQIPHFYVNMDIELDALLALRKQLNDSSDGSFKISVNDMVIKAAAVALKRVPEVNASWTDDGIKLYKTADIAVAVSIDGGLITPVVREAENKGLATISSQMKELAGKAREGKLMPEEYQGGTFSISNMGMFGVDSFNAIVNPPQAAILAVGAGKQQAVVKDGALSIATVMTLTLSVDHRAVDGAVGAQYMAELKKIIEFPASLML